MKLDPEVVLRLRDEERRWRLALRSTIGFAQWRNHDFAPQRFHRALGSVCDRVVDTLADPDGFGWYAISAPPRHGKTELVGRCVGPRAMALRPGLSVLYMTASQDRAVEVSDRARRAVERLSERYPHLRPGRRWTTTEWETVGGNRWVGTGIDSSTGGIDGALLILDDVTGSADRYASKARRDRMWRSIQEDALSRGVRVAIVMETRRGVDDVRARFERDFSGNLCRYDFPLIYDTTHRDRAPDYDERSLGEYLWPERYGEDWHDRNPQVRGQLYAQLYQQRPTPDEGALWVRAWLSHHYAPPPESMAAACPYRVLSVDGAATHGRGDHTVIDHVGFRDEAAHLLGKWRGQWDYPALKATLRNAIVQVRPHAILIEDTSNGRAVRQELQREFPGVIPISVAGLGNKRARIQPTLGLWESGAVRLPMPQHAPWVPDYVERLLVVTGLGDEVDDDADAITIALRHWQERQARSAPTARQVLRVLGR